jgi:hypothetical protein
MGMCSGMWFRSTLLGSRRWDNMLIPTGELSSVVGTPFDFRQPTAIGAQIDDPNEQLKFAKGYDHNWIIHKTAPGAHRPRHGV